MKKLLKLKKLLRLKIFFITMTLFSYLNLSKDLEIGLYD